MEDSDVIEKLHKEMARMPDRMNSFSKTLRSLYQEQDYTNASANFQLLRDKVRSDAVIFSKKVLPLSDLVVLNMRGVFDNYAQLEYEDWKECVEEIIEEVQQYEKLCTLLVQLYGDLMTSLKQSQDEASKNIVGIDELNIELNAMMSKLKIEIEEQELMAKEHGRAAENISTWANVLAIPTLGISKLATHNVVERNHQAARNASAEAKQGMEKQSDAIKDFEIAKQACFLTKGVLIPCIEEFLGGLSACATFFADTRAELELMGKGGDSAVSKRHYKLMSSKAKKIITDCKCWVAAIPEMRSDLDAIPAETCDKIHAEEWMDRQMLVFEEKQGTPTNSLMMKQMNLALKRW